MSRYGKIIEQAKSQNAVKPENQKTGKQGNSKTRNVESKNTRKPEKKIVSKTNEREVNLSIKVPESRRRHWAAEAKRRGTSLTAVIVESLSRQFGEPE